MNNTLSPLSPLTEVIRTRRQAALRRRDSVGLLVNSLLTVVLAVVFVLLFLLFFHLRIVEGDDMYPSLSDGDLVLCCGERDYRKGDIVRYTADGDERFGRVMAKGGDQVRLTPEGALLVNGTTQNYEIIFPTYPVNGEETAVTVPADSFFVLGDYRTEAADSRQFGCISQDDVRDKVIVLLRHRKL